MQQRKWSQEPPDFVAAFRDQNHNSRDYSFRSSCGATFVASLAD